MNTYTISRQDDYSPIQMILPLEVGVQIPSDDPLRTFLKVMEGVNLRQYIRHHSGKGRNGYDSDKMLKIILFAYMNQIYTLRQIEHACRTDIRFMYLAQEETPSFQTIGQFIKKSLKGESIEKIFTAVNRRIFEMDGVSLNDLYVDGTAYEANANKFTFVWKKTALKTQARKLALINEELTLLSELFQEYGISSKPISTAEEGYLYLESLDRIMQEAGMEKKCGRGHRKTTLQRHVDLIRTALSKLQECEEKIQICGNDRSSYSKTDRDATFMHMKYDYYCNTGVFKPGYNVQFGISDEYISVLQVSNARSDSRTLPKTIDQFRKQYSVNPETLIADAGYGSYNNYIYCLSNHIQACIKYNTWEKETVGAKMKPYDSGQFRYEPDRMICPEGKTLYPEKEIYSEDQEILKITRHYRCHDCRNCPHHSECTKSTIGRTIQYNPVLLELRENARQILGSESGKEYRRKRSIYSEGTFGILKQDYEYIRLHRRGTENVKTEVTLTALGFNLKKYHDKLCRPIILN